MIKFGKLLVLTNRYIKDSVMNFENHRSLETKNTFANAPWDFYASLDFRSMFQQ